RKPRETVVSANSGVVEAILAIAPRAKRHATAWVCIDDTVRPAGRYHDLLSRLRQDRNTASRVVFGPLLRINDRRSTPYLEDFRRRPVAMRGNGVNVALGTHRLGAKGAGGINNRTEEKHALLKQSAVGLTSDVHGNSVDGIRPAALGIAQAGPNRIQPPHLRCGTKHAAAVLERKDALRKTERKFRIKLERYGHQAPSRT